MLLRVLRRRLTLLRGGLMLLRRSRSLLLGWNRLPLLLLLLSLALRL